MFARQFASVFVSAALRGLCVCIACTDLVESSPQAHGADAPVLFDRTTSVISRPLDSPLLKAAGQGPSGKDPKRDLSQGPAMANARARTWLERPGK